MNYEEYKELKKEYYYSGLNKFISFSDFENYMGFMSIENLKKEFDIN